LRSALREGGRIDAAFIRFHIEMYSMGMTISGPKGASRHGMATC
jgi:hypothetical protein